MKKLARIFRFDLPAHLILLLTNWLPDSVLFLRLRGALLTPFLGSCGRNLRLGRNITFYNPSQIYIGNDVYIAYGCWFMAGAAITIDDEVMFGPYCVIVSSNHSRLNGSFRFGPPIQEPIYIGKGAWIASHVTVTAGTSIGNGCIVAANSVVTHSIPDNVLAAGQPARVLRGFADEA